VQFHFVGSWSQLKAECTGFGVGTTKNTLKIQISGIKLQDLYDNSLFFKTL
jgi:phosphoenolpyruvate carboxylase